MREGTEYRRLAGLSIALLGLTAVFASLTLIAVARPGLAACFSLTGLLLVLIGLRCLPAGPA